MIGRRCKAGDSLSRAALIARALTRRIPAGAVFHVLGGCNSGRRGMGSGELAVRPPGHAEGTPQRGRQSHRLETSAAHRSAAMAGGARPDPFRTRKLSRRAPMVLRGQPMGEQGAADRWTALDPYIAGSGAGAPRGDPLRGAPFFFSISFSRGPFGALFPCRGGLRSSAASPGRPFTGAAPRGPPRQGAVPLGAGDLAGIPREPLCRPPAAPAGQGPGARPAGTVRGRRFGYRELGRPPCPPPI